MARKPPGEESSKAATFMPLKDSRPSTNNDYTNAYLERVDEECLHRPYLNIVSAFIRNETTSNSACVDRSQLAKNTAIFGRTASGWIRGSNNTPKLGLERLPGADMHVVVLDYLDSETVLKLGAEFDVDPGFFYSHLAGSEQHYSGTWRPSNMSKAPPVLSDRLEAPYFSVTYRRCYTGASQIKDKTKYLLGFDKRRIETCTILRSFHRSQMSKRIFSCERFTVSHHHGDLNSKWGPVVIFLCDPLIPEETEMRRPSLGPEWARPESWEPHRPSSGAQPNSLMAHLLRWIASRPHSFKSDDWLAELLTGPMRAIIYHWSSVAQDMEHQVSASEDQLEGDFWDEQRNPRRVLTTIQRLGRRLLAYYEQVNAAKTDLAPWLADGRSGQVIQADLAHLERQFEVLTQRAHRTVPSLSTYITMEESRRTSRLTMVALLFAPLSLLASFLSIDGRSSIGGTKYWIFIAVAIPALVLIVGFSRPFGGFRQKIQQWKTDRVLGRRLGNWNAQNLT